MLARRRWAIWQARLRRYLREHDGAEHTVIALQIENEPGILGSDRDYGPLGEAAFHSPVPAALLDRIKVAQQSRLHPIWQAAGARAAGTWQEVFGDAAGELMTAWSIATYIDGLAAAGKAVYDIPMYVNVWLGESGWAIPGESYPSGGAVSKVLDIYRWCAPHLDLIAPDIYIADSRTYEAVCAAYAREDNPLFVPESAPGGPNAWNMFRAVAEYGAIGYHFFAVEHIVAEDGEVRPEARPLVDSFRSLAAAAPLLLRYQGTERIHAVVQEENLHAQRLDLGAYVGLVEFGDGPRIHRDWRHRDAPAQGERGRGIVVQAGPHEFYLVGAGYRLILRPKLPPAQALDVSVSREHLLTRLAHYVRVDEGHFDADGVFVVDRRRNGDEVDHGVWVEADVGVVRATLCE